MARERERDADKELSMASREPHVRLAMAVLKQAVLDIGSGDVSAAHWLLSEEARQYCAFVGLDEQAVKRHVLAAIGVDGEMSKQMSYARANEILDEAIKRVSRERGLSYQEAYRQLQKEKPGLFDGRQAAWVREQRERELVKLGVVKSNTTGAN